jgi:hypothetical protein
MVSYGELAEIDESTSYTGQRAKQWGRTGPPAGAEAIAGRHKLGAAALLKSSDDMGAALQQGKPCTICTARGFSMQRDKQGFCRMQGRWGHCMFVAGYRADRPGGLVVQSWGPDQPEGPTDLDQPTFSFWAEWDDLARIIDEGDSYAIAGTAGFARQSLPRALHTA